MNKNVLKIEDSLYMPQLRWKYKELGNHHSRVSGACMWRFKDCRLKNINEEDANFVNEKLISLNLLSHKDVFKIGPSTLDLTRCMCCHHRPHLCDEEAP